MHLSILSDASITREHVAIPRRASAGRAHRDGVLRGLVFIAAISVPLSLAIVTGHAQTADASAGYGQSFEAQR